MTVAYPRKFKKTMSARDIIKALPQKTEISTPGRPKRFIAIGISIAAMAMSTFNTVRITQLNEEISTLKEEDGIDFQPITVQLPGGERVPLFFTIKGFTGKTEAGFNSINSSTDFEGEFKVPSYRGAGFLDPKMHRIRKIR